MLVEKTVFRATMSDARLFRNLIGAISSLIEKAAFDTYECSTPTRLRLSVSNLLKLLKRTHSDESIEIFYDEANKKLNITLRNKIVRKFITPTLEPSTEEVPTPKVPFSARVKLAAASLRDIIDDAQAIRDNVRLEVSPDKFLIKASGE